VVDGFTIPEAATVGTSVRYLLDWKEGRNVRIANGFALVGLAP
jgi:hypothetical protein